MFLCIILSASISSACCREVRNKKPPLACLLKHVISIHGVVVREWGLAHQCQAVLEKILDKRLLKVKDEMKMCSIPGA